MLIKGQTVGDRGNIIKHSIFISNTSNLSEIISDLRQYYGWQIVNVVEPDGE
jgi:hypothetical protein